VSPSRPGRHDASYPTTLIVKLVVVVISGVAAALSPACAWLAELRPE
jgi:hypothetical protein